MRAMALLSAHSGIGLDAPTLHYLREHAKQELDPVKHKEKSMLHTLSDLARARGG